MFRLRSILLSLFCLALSAGFFSSLSLLPSCISVSLFSLVSVPQTWTAVGLVLSLVIIATCCCCMLWNRHSTDHKDFRDDGWNEWGSGGVAISPTAASSGGAAGGRSTEVGTIVDDVPRLKGIDGLGTAGLAALVAENESKQLSPQSPQVSSSQAYAYQHARSDVSDVGSTFSGDSVTSDSGTALRKKADHRGNGNSNVVEIAMVELKPSS